MKTDLSIYDVAKILGKSPATVKEMIYMGRLKAEKIGGSWKVKVSDLPK